MCSVPTLDGDKNVTIRPGAQSGDRLRLRGVGIVQLGSQRRGDQFIILQCGFLTSVCSLAAAVSLLCTGRTTCSVLHLAC